jgi:zinc D-Ala-D-Ala carboxypeptidase
MMRDRRRDVDSYTRRVNALHRRLQIPQDYARRGLSFHREAPELVAVPCGFDGQNHLMTPETRSQWFALQAAAGADGIILWIRWAFRSVDDQAQLIRDELSRGDKSIEQVMTRIAAPGYSEHHTGRALDLDCRPAERAFEESKAFEWLCQHAGRFGFALSYPRDNRYGLIFEPWHWCYRAGEASRVAGTLSELSGR